MLNTHYSPCFGAKPHSWSTPMTSPVYGCTVRVCAACGRVGRVSNRKKENVMDATDAEQKETP